MDDPEQRATLNRIVNRFMSAPFNSPVPNVSVVYCDLTERNRIAMSRHCHNVASHHYDGSRHCCYSRVI
jgi:hypothetical protein